MNTSTDFDRIAQDWLQDGPTELADRALQAALDEVHLTSQQHFGAARRTLHMNSYATRLAAAAAIGLLILIGGGIYLGNTGSGGIGGQPTAAAAPSPTAAPSARLAPTPREIPLGGMPVTEAGRYFAADPFGIPASIEVPAGWTVAREGEQFVVVGPKMDKVEISFQLFDNAYADPCHYDQNPAPVVLPDTVDALVSALTSLPSLDVTTPTDITVDGYAGKELTMTAPASFDGCTLSPDGFALWNIPNHSNRTIKPGERQRLWILDVAGQRLVILALESPDITDQERTAIQAALDSIEVGPLAPEASPSITP